LHGTNRRLVHLPDLYGRQNMDEEAGSPKRENKQPPPCAACDTPMKLITTIADPLVKRVRLFECTDCRTTAFIKES
jgi:hypothetical protein